MNQLFNIYKREIIKIQSMLIIYVDYYPLTKNIIRKLTSIVQFSFVTPVQTNNLREKKIATTEERSLKWQSYTKIHDPIRNQTPKITVVYEFRNIVTDKILKYTLNSLISVKLQMARYINVMIKLPITNSKN